MVLIMWRKHRCVVGCRNNNLKSKRTWIDYVAKEWEWQGDRWMKENIYCLRSAVRCRRCRWQLHSINLDKHKHNYLVSARLILNRVPYWFIHNSIKIMNTHSLNACKNYLIVAFDDRQNTRKRHLGLFALCGAILALALRSGQNVHDRYIHRFKMII